MPMNTANKLTLARVFMIPLFLVIAYWGFPGSRYVALGVYILACLTDLLDGYVARHYNQVSDFGKFADPLADKCLVMAALCWFVETGDMVGWVLAVVLLREFAVSGMRLIAVEKGRVIAAGWSGKVKTASTMVCICLMLFGIPHWLNLVCQGVILATTVYSGVEYFAKNCDFSQYNYYSATPTLSPKNPAGTMLLVRPLWFFCKQVRTVRSDPHCRAPYS